MGIKSAKAKKRQDKKQTSRGPAPLVVRDEFQEYGRITKICGNCRFMVLLSDMKEYLGILCKRMFKRAWISVDHIVLISRRDFQTDKIDIIHRYNDDDVRKLAQTTDFPSMILPHQNTHSVDNNLFEVTTEDTHHSITHDTAITSGPDHGDETTIDFDTI